MRMCSQYQCFVIRADFCGWTSAWRKWDLLCLMCYAAMPTEARHISITLAEASGHFKWVFILRPFLRRQGCTWESARKFTIIEIWGEEDSPAEGSTERLSSSSSYHFNQSCFQFRPTSMFLCSMCQVLSPGLASFRRNWLCFLLLCGNMWPHRHKLPVSWRISAVSLGGGSGGEWKDSPHKLNHHDHVGFPVPAMCTLWTTANINEFWRCICNQEFNVDLSGLMIQRGHSRKNWCRESTPERTDVQWILYRELMQRGHSRVDNPERIDPEMILQAA